MEPSDEDLLQRMSAGDEEAFVSLYRRRQAGIYRFALHMSGSAAVAEDVTQEVFLALMRDPAGFDPARGSLAAYLYGIARNQVRRFFERGWPEPLDQATRSPDDPHGELARAESIEAVRSAVLALPPRYRELVVLCDLQEASYEEAAAALGCAVGTVRSRLHRARALLAKRLGANPARCLI